LKERSVSGGLLYPLVHVRRRPAVLDWTFSPLIQFFQQLALVLQQLVQLLMQILDDKL